MNKRIDIHSLYMPNETPNPIGRPVPGIENDILQARINAFQSAPEAADYVSFIDPYDNILIPDIFERAIDFLDDHWDINGVYTNSILQTLFVGSPLLSGHEWSKDYQADTLLPIHQLIIVRKEAMLQAINDLQHRTTFQPEQLLYAHITPWYFFNELAYEWNRSDFGYSQRAIDWDERAAALRYRREVLLK